MEEAGITRRLGEEERARAHDSDKAKVPGDAFDSLKNKESLESGGVVLNERDLERDCSPGDK